MTACAPPSGPSALHDAPGPKRVDVSRSIETHFVEFQPGETRVTERERDALLAFLRELDAGRRDSVTVRNDDRMPSPLARDRRTRVQTLLRDQGFRAVSAGSGTPLQTSWADSRGRNSILVQVLHYRAHATGCPDFSRPGMSGFENYTSSNFGCATAQNLGAMVAEPRDLVEGREPGPADGTRMGQSIERYRNDEVKTGDDDATTPTATTGQ